MSTFGQASGHTTATICYKKLPPTTSSTTTESTTSTASTTSTTTTTTTTTKGWEELLEVQQFHKVLTFFENTLWEACLIDHHLPPPIIIDHHRSRIIPQSSFITIYRPPYHFFCHPFFSIAPGTGVTNDRYTVSADSFCSNALDSSAPSTLGTNAVDGRAMWIFTASF